MHEDIKSYIEHNPLLRTIVAAVVMLQIVWSQLRPSVKYATGGWPGRGW